MKTQNEYGALKSSVRYCLKCRENTTFMPLGKGHSECLNCGNTYGKSPFSINAQLKQQIKEYYAAADLYLPNDPGHRHYRFFDTEGVPNKIKDRIYYKEQLRKKLLWIKPLNSYYSLAYFLNPTVIGKRDYSKPSQNSFLGMDYVVDIDDLEFPLGLNTEKIIYFYDFLWQDTGIKPKIRFSGAGIHLVLEKFCWFYYNSFKKREEASLQRIREYTERLLQKGFEFNDEVSKDTRRIIKLPGTVTKYGNLCEEISVERLKNFRPKIIIPDIKIEKDFNLNKEIERCHSLI